MVDATDDNKQRCKKKQGLIIHILEHLLCARKGFCLAKVVDNAHNQQSHTDYAVAVVIDAKCNRVCGFGDK